MYYKIVNKMIELGILASSLSNPPLITFEKPIFKSLNNSKQEKKRWREKEIRI